MGLGCRASLFSALRGTGTVPKCCQASSDTGQRSISSTHSCKLKEESGPAQAGVTERVPVADKWSLPKIPSPEPPCQPSGWPVVPPAAWGALTALVSSVTQAPGEAGCSQGQHPCPGKGSSHRADPPRLQLPHREETQLLPHCRRV